MTSRDPRMCYEAVRSAILATAWLLVTRARRYASAGLCDCNVSVCPFVCPSVCPSRAGIVSKRRKLVSWFLYHLHGSFTVLVIWC